MESFIHLLTSPFVLRAIAGGILVAASTSIVGVFAVIRKASFYGDTLAHTALTGVALGLLLGVDPFISALVIGLLVSVLLPLLQQQSQQHIDTLLGVLLPVAMAIGVLLLYLKPGYKADIASYLFGNILAISWQYVGLIGAAFGIILLLLGRYFPKLTAVAVDPGYAVVTGLSAVGITMIHNVLLTLAIIPSISLVGIILVNALLIIPAAVAKQSASSFRHMFLLAPLISLSTTLGGILLSLGWNLPTGPTIVTLLGLLFLGSSLRKRF